MSSIPSSPRTRSRRRPLHPVGKGSAGRTWTFVHAGFDERPSPEQRAKVHHRVSTVGFDTDAPPLVDLENTRGHGRLTVGGRSGGHSLALDSARPCGRGHHEVASTTGPPPT